MDRMSDEEFEEVKSSLSKDIVYRRPKTPSSDGSSTPTVPQITLEKEKRISETKPPSKVLFLDIGKASNVKNSREVDINLTPDISKKTSRLSPEPGFICSASSGQIKPKKEKAKSKKPNKDGQVSAAEIGPAIAAGITMGASIVTTNGVSTPSSKSNTPTHLSRASSENDSSDSDCDNSANAKLVAGRGGVPQCPIPHDQGKETVNEIIPCSVDQLFTYIFTKSKFYMDLHTSRKTFDIVQADWQKSDDGAHKSRQVSFTVTLTNVMGPKHSFVTETQTLLPVSAPGLLYAVDSETINNGIPYADSFYVTSHFCLSRVSDNESKLIIVNQIKFRKSVWGVKGFIEKNCWEGITDFYCHLARALKEECSKSDCLGDSPKKSDGLARRRRARKSHAPTAPEPPRKASIHSSNGTAGSSLLSNSNLGDNSMVLKVLLSILAGLLLLNAFLFIKLGHLETIANTPPNMFQHNFFVPKEIPQTHHEWLNLLQHQDSLHRLELQKWHEILTSALHILNQAESGLESLKIHIVSTYDQGRTLQETVLPEKDSTKMFPSSVDVSSGLETENSSLSRNKRTISSKNSSL